MNTTRRRILESGQRQSGQLIAGLKPPCEFPESLREIYQIFNDELTMQRDYSQFGPQSLTDLHFAAWQFNSGIRLNPFEIRALRALDSLTLRVAVEPNKNTNLAASKLSSGEMHA